MTRKDLDNMTPDEVRATLAKLRNRQAELLKGQEMTYETLAALRHDELSEIKKCMVAELSILKGEGVPPQAALPTPAKPAKGAKMTKKMRQRIERFDAMSDGEQLDHLAGLFGEDGQS